MGEPARHQDDKVVEMVGYLRETLSEIDDTIAELTRRRRGISVRLAVIEAATTPAVEEAMNDFDDRTASGRPYKGRDAEAVLSEAHRRYCK